MTFNCSYGAELGDSLSNYIFKFHHCDSFRLPTFLISTLAGSVQAHDLIH